jgi:hypothetical protein
LGNGNLALPKNLNAHVVLTVYIKGAYHPWVLLLGCDKGQQHPLAELTRQPDRALNGDSNSAGFDFEISNFDHAVPTNATSQCHLATTTYYNLETIAF